VLKGRSHVSLRGDKVDKGLQYEFQIVSSQEKYTHEVDVRILLIMAKIKLE
jgi:hypothetical protein